VLSPTRELATQNLSVITELSKYMKITSKLIVPDADGLPRRLGEKISFHILCGTPGKMREVVCRKKNIDPRGVKMLVIDEADVMIDEVVNVILKFLPVFSEQSAGFHGS
jgi:superfamily II DNA/RNA helicase